MTHTNYTQLPPDITRKLREAQEILESQQLQGLYGDIVPTLLRLHYWFRKLQNEGEFFIKDLLKILIEKESPDFLKTVYCVVILWERPSAHDEIHLKINSLNEAFFLYVRNEYKEAFKFQPDKEIPFRDLYFIKDCIKAETPA